MDLYLGAQQGTLPSSQNQDFSDILIDYPVTSSSLHGKLDSATSEAMKDLKIEVMERLGRLQQTLCI